jgi:hypothetical protein
MPPELGKCNAGLEKKASSAGYLVPRADVLVSPSSLAG